MPLVLKSPYVLGITLFVVLISAANTFLYFDQLRLVTEAYADPAARTRFFARLDSEIFLSRLPSRFFRTPLGRFGAALFLVLAPGLSRAQSPPKVSVAYAAISPIFAGIWMAKEIGAFEKQGLKSDLIYISSGSITVQAMMGGNVDMSIAASNAVVSAILVRMAWTRNRYDDRAGFKELEPRAEGPHEVAL